MSATTATQTTYDAAGRVVSETDARGNSSSHEYDAAGRRIASTDALGNTVAFTYDADGNMLTQTDARGNAMTYVYNELDQRKQVQYADGTVTKTDYDKRGLSITQFDQNNRSTSFGYDGLGRLLTVTDAIGQVTSYGYDEVGNKLTQTDAKDRVTSWDYDALGRPESRTLPLGQSESYTYDAVGNRITHTDFNGATHSFIYEPNNDWLLSEQYADGKTINYSYNAIGQRKTATDNQGSYGYDYDTMDRLTLETKPNGDSIGYGYDANGNRTTLTTTVNGQASVASYVFDALNRMSSVTDSDNRTTGYTYDANSNQTNIAQANGTSSITTFDALNRITNITHKAVDNSTLLGLTYTLDPTGRRSAITETTGRVSTYSYDTLYRLTGDAIVDPVNGNHNATYEYDEVGNRIYETINGVQTQYIIDDNDRLSQQGGTSYQYDDNGNTINETLDGITTTTYTYDSRKRLIATDKGGAQIDMAYDPDGIRVQKVVDGEATDYLVDSNRAYAQVLFEKTGASELGYTFGTDLVGLDTGSESYSYQTDALGSTRLLSDGNGLVADTPAFDAWGVKLAGGDVSENQYLFTGEQFDSELGKVYLRARYMDTIVGRFTQQDVWLGGNASPITLNKYAYGNSDSANFIDPSGYFSMISSMSSMSSSLSSAARASATGLRALGKVAKVTFTMARTVGPLLKKELRTCRRTKGKKCRLPNIAVIGSDYSSAQKHIFDAQSSNGTYVNSHLGVPGRSPTRLIYEKGGNTSSWYVGKGACVRGSHGGTTGKQCDEYPFAASKEGKRKGWDRGRVSLRPIQRVDNRGAGGIWKGATGVKGVVSGKTRIMVVPYGPISFYFVKGVFGPVRLR